MTFKSDALASAKFDLVGRLFVARPGYNQALVIVLCSASAIIVRMAIDQFLPGASPFILIYPAITVATLVGGWLTGSLTLAILFLYAWFAVMPLEDSFHLAESQAADWLVLAFVTAVSTIIMAEFIRLTHRKLVEERKEKIEHQQLLLREVNHRVGNNFAIITSLLSLQVRNATGSSEREAIETAISRVQALAEANDNLYVSAEDLVDLKLYLCDLCSRIAKAIFLPTGIVVTCECSAVKMQRDRAVAIGLITNELLTNAAKHAFKGRDRGRIAVRLDNRGGPLTLSVSDDGVGFPEKVRLGALGQKLVSALCIQAGGSPDWRSDATGTTFLLNLEPPQ